MALPQHDDSPPGHRLRRATIKKHSTPFPGHDETVSIEQAQQDIWQAMTDYLATENPAHILLVKAPPGVGKTTLAVGIAEERATTAHERRKRVMYAGPRHEFFQDVMAIAQRPEWWYEWLPRQAGSETKPETCHYACQINTWIARGYAARDFCENHLICGPSYAYQECPWHQQKKRTEPILFVQHQHVMSHPLMDTADLLIGDELPLPAFVEQTGNEPGKLIRRDDIVIQALDEGDLKAMLRRMRQLVDTLRADGRKEPISGVELLHSLGGATHVADVCASATIPAACLAPYIRSADEADEVPLNYLGTFLRLINREAHAARSQLDYPPRVLLSQRGLTLLSRRWPSQETPRHIIWLDATGDPALYEEMFGRPVQVVAPNVALQGRVYQVWNSLNTKAGVKDSGKQDNLATQVRQIIDKHGYQCPGLIAYRDLLSVFRFIPDTRKAYFYAARGTNRLQDCDALIVVGTPSPGGDIERTAAMLYQDRMKRFRAQWLETDVGFPGTLYSILAANYHADNDLAVLLRQHREAELLQAAHRARPVRNPSDVWLLTNLPIPGLSPELLTVNDLFDVPSRVNEFGMREYADVDPYHWHVAMQIAAERCETAGLVTSKDIADGIGCTAPSARKYIMALVEHCGYMLINVAPDGRGKPPIGAIPGLFRAEY